MGTLVGGWGKIFTASKRYRLWDCDIIYKAEGKRLTRLCKPIEWVGLNRVEAD